MSSLLITDVTVGDRPGQAMHVVDDRIAWLGAAADAPRTDCGLDGGGALLTPAFVDAHVHATATGLSLTGLALHGAGSLRAAVARIAEHAAAVPTGTVLGTGWDETGWPEGRGLTRADLDAVVGEPVDVTVVCVDVPGAEHGAVLATAEGGTVVFFSMATSFSAAALGAEGMAADVTMLVGNGYTPGHAALALDLYRRSPGVRALIDPRVH